MNRKDAEKLEPGIMDIGTDDTKTLALLSLAISMKRIANNSDEIRWALTDLKDIYQSRG